MKNRFIPQTIEIISKILGNETTGSKITIMLNDLRLLDDLGPSETKWKRLYNAIVNHQNKFNSGESLILITEWILSPVLYMNDNEKKLNYPNILKSVNDILCYSGLSINDQGKITETEKISSHQKAINRCNSLKNLLKPFQIHPRILAACRPELLTDNYFHLVFESSKLVLNKISEISDLSLDGNKLISECFDGKNPLLVINTLQTADEISEHKALQSLLNFITYFYRNPRAHKLKIYSPTSESDAIIALSNISSALKLLDKCQRNLSRNH